MKEQYTLEELCQILAMSRRTIRYYIQESLVDKPEGQKRGSYYTTKHLKQLQQIQEWQGAGFSLDRIRQMLQGDESPAETLLKLMPQRGAVTVCSHIQLAIGIELVIKPEQAGLSPEQLRALYKQIGVLIDEIQANDE